MPSRPPTVLVIDVSDSTGGSGLETAQRILALQGCYAFTATTALSVQDKQGAYPTIFTPPAFLRRQLEAVLKDLEVDVVQVGVLCGSENVEVVPDVLRRWQESETVKGRSGCIVMSLVRSLSWGMKFVIPDNVLATIQKELLPLTTVLTLNISDALHLARQNFPGDLQRLELKDGLDDLKSLARVIQGKPFGPQAVLIKGAILHKISKHGDSERGEALVPMMIDVLFDGADFTIIEPPSPLHYRYINGKMSWFNSATSSLNSAIAANIASGRLLQTAVLEAYHYVEAGIKADFAIGHDSHTINHFHTMQVQPFSSGHFIDYLITRRDVNPMWRAYTQHKFVRAVGDGSLPLDVFKRFLVQDYLYLTQFARTNALAAYKSNDMEEIAASAQIVLGVQKEMALHLEYFQDFGMSKQEMEATRESQATVAYSRYVLDIGQSGDWLGLQIAMASCLVGYQTAAEWVKAQPGSKRENNRYWKWVDNYGGEEYAEGVRLGREMIEKHASKISPQRVEELVRIFIRVTEMEINFWEFDAHLR